MRLSVALCTHNGQRHLQDQLDSILAQSRIPDELVVHDDASSDGTVAILRDFGRHAPFPVCLTINGRRLGSTGNFQNAIAAATGDVIALCDQDDVWRPEKLARLEASFARSAQPGCVFSDAEVVGPALQPLGYRLWQTVRFDGRKQRQMAAGASIDVLLQQNVVTGATMAFRAEFRDLLLPMPRRWVHDGWIALLVAAVAGCLPLNEPLIRYRQHPSQQIGGLKRTVAQRVAVARKMDSAFFSSLAEDYQAARDRLAKSRAYPCPDAVLWKLDAKIAHCRRRAAIRGSRWRGLPLIASEFVSGRYDRYSLGWQSVASDLFL